MHLCIFWMNSVILNKYNHAAAAAAKLLQSCPTLCDPIDGSPSGSPVPGILQARTLEWVAIAFSGESLSSVQFSRSVVSDSLRPHESQHAGLPCLSPTSGVHQTHVHWVSDAIQPSHPLSSPSPPAPNPSQHQSLFQWVNSLHEVAKGLEFQLQHHSFQRTPRADLL